MHIKLIRSSCLTSPHIPVQSHREKHLAESFSMFRLSSSELSPSDLFYFRYGKVAWHSRLQTFVCFIVLSLISYSLCLSSVHLINSACHSYFRQLWGAPEFSCEHNQTHFCEHRLTGNGFPLLSDELEDLMTSQMFIAPIQQLTHLISGEKNLLWLFPHQ